MLDTTIRRTRTSWAPIGATAFMLALASPRHVQAADIYLPDARNAVRNEVIRDGLAEIGHDATLGGPIEDIEDEPLEDYAVVVAQLLFDADEGAQDALMEYVESGGGLVLFEWSTWQVANLTTLTTIEPAIPVTWASETLRDATTYMKETADGVLHRGLPNAFTFESSYLTGYESEFMAKPDATVYFRNDLGWPSVVGWTYGQGHIVCISTVPGEENMSDENYLQLVDNAIEWAGGKLEGRDGSQFGRTIENVGDLDGDDIDDLVVGAPFDDENGNKSGKIHVISGATCATLYIKRGGNAGDRFGWSIARTGDLDDDGYNDFLVGAPWNDNQGNNSGSVKLLSGLDGTLIAKWFGEQPGDRFGYALGSVDVDNDGQRDALIGAPYNDEEDDKAGKVYAYSGDGFDFLGSILGKSKGDRFGWSVAGVGKMNAGGHKDFIVGAPYEDSVATNAGKVYAISGKDFEVLYTKRGRAAGDRFGWSVDGVGIVDDDGFRDFIVGSPFHDTNDSYPNAGLVEVFSGLTGGRIFEWVSDHATARAGWSVAGAGDVDGDGYDDIIFGVPWLDSGDGDNLGAYAVIWALDSNTPTGNGFAGTERRALTGYAVAAVHGLDGDDSFASVVGAPKSDAYEKDGGMVSIMMFDDDPSVASETSGTITFEVIEDRATDITPVVLTGDLDGDGRVDNADLLALLDRWGDEGGAADLTGDGRVGAADLLALLGLMSAG